MYAAIYNLSKYDLEKVEENIENILKENSTNSFG